MPSSLLSYSLAAQSRAADFKFAGLSHYLTSEMEQRLLKLLCEILYFKRCLVALNRLQTSAKTGSVMTKYLYYYANVNTVKKQVWS